jgi:hypothetical protein
MPDYSKCVIYTIRTGEGLYVGSTCNFNNRKYQHKYNINFEDSCKYKYKLYETIRANDGAWDMQPHSQYPCNSKMEMTIEEERIRLELKADLNTNSCYTNNKEYLKEYYRKNKEKLNINANEKISCECGGKYTRQNKLNHFKTQKHLKYIKDSQAHTPL